MISDLIFFNFFSTAKNCFESALMSLKSSGMFEKRRLFKFSDLTSGESAELVADRPARVSVVSEGI